MLQDMRAVPQRGARRWVPGRGYRGGGGGGTGEGGGGGGGGLRGLRGLARFSEVYRNFSKFCDNLRDFALPLSGKNDVWRLTSPLNISWPGAATVLDPAPAVFVFALGLKGAVVTNLFTYIIIAVAC